MILVNAPQIQFAERAPLYDISRVEFRRANSPALSFEVNPIQSNIFMTIPDLLKLQPGQKYQEKANLLSGFWYCYKEHYQFAAPMSLEPGQYRLQAEYSWYELPYATPERLEQLDQMNAPLWTGSLKSNTVALTVIAK